MRVLLAILAAALFAGCTIPAATLESTSVAPESLDQSGRLDAAYPEARFLIHVPAGASGVRFDLTWASAQENLAPEATLLDLHGQPASTGGHQTAGGGPRGASYGGITSGVWDAPPGDYLLRVGFPFAFPQGDAFDVALHAGPSA
jgi:hypothetical protein